MRSKGFTLVELLVVIAILGLLSTVAVVATNSARINARNTKRKADLVQISKALDLYYADNGGYPSTGSSVDYEGISNRYGSHDDSGANGWIPNLAPTYIGTLPRDPNYGKVNPGSPQPSCRTTPEFNLYLYVSDGIDYKLMAYCTPEGTLLSTDPFYNSPYPGSSWAIFTPGAKLW